MSKKKIKQRNFVQMHVQDFCVPKVFEDRKIKAKKGYLKHKKNLLEENQTVHRPP